MKELREISPLLAGLEKTKVYAVPAGYFDGMADGLLGLVKNEGSPLLAGIKKQQTDSVPEGYFDTLAQTILDKIKSQEAVETYPVLDTISKQNVYTVPKDYFETLGTEINAKLQQPAAKVVSITKRSSWFKYAAAAVFTGMVALGLYKFTGGSQSSTAVMPGYVAEGQKIKNVDEELAKVNDEDIIKYLQADGTDVDAAVVANVMDANELPSKEDYMTDDKALDKYLDNIDLTDLKN